MGQRGIIRTALPPATSSLDESLRLLGTMATVLGQHFDVPLPVPALRSSEEKVTVKNGKKFSVGLLEDPVDHDWSGDRFRRLCSHERTTIAGSLFLWRKTLPSSAAPYTEHRDRVTAPEIALPAGYIPHLVRVVEESFPVGWDVGYCGNVERAVPTVKSVSSRGRAQGGYRSLMPCRESFGRTCMGMSDYSGAFSVVKHMVAQCDGKSRDVTVMSAEAQFLGPLHKCIYDQISKTSWLLRGEAKPSAFSDFVRKSGEVFVSGDYESATDNLPVTSAEWILRAIFRRARYIPLSVQVAALEFLRVTIVYGEESHVATRQLMGSFLCFPLLCLQNYAAFRWVFPRTVPVRINGDDIVFRSTYEDYERWAEFVSSVGLVLSPGKTMVSTSQFSLNSTFFSSLRDRVRLIPVVRCTSLLSMKSPYPGSLSGSFSRFLKGFRGELRCALGAWFLKEKAALIRKSGRSVVRGLRIPATRAMLMESGLWQRELWYVNSIPSRYDDGIGSYPKEGVDLPMAPDRLQGQVSLPPGWVLSDLPRDPRRRAKALEDEREFWDIVTESAWGSPWDPRTAEDAFWRRLEGTGFEASYREWCRPKKGFAYRLLGGKCKSRLRTKPLFNILNMSMPRRAKKVWLRVPDDILFTCKRPSVEFYPPPEDLTSRSAVIGLFGGSLVGEIAEGFIQ